MAAKVPDGLLDAAISFAEVAENRAPSRTAFCRTWCSRRIKPKSTIPTNIIASSGRTIANSTRAAPRWNSGARLRTLKCRNLESVPRIRILWTCLIAHQCLSFECDREGGEHRKRHDLVRRLHPHSGSARDVARGSDDQTIRQPHIPIDTNEDPCSRTADSRVTDRCGVEEPLDRIQDLGVRGLQRCLS